MNDKRKRRNFRKQVFVTCPNCNQSMFIDYKTRPPEYCSSQCRIAATKRNRRALIAEAKHDYDSLVREGKRDKARIKWLAVDYESDLLDLITQDHNESEDN